MTAVLNADSWFPTFLSAFCTLLRFQCFSSKPYTLYYYIYIISPYYFYVQSDVFNLLKDAVKTSYDINLQTAASNCYQQQQQLMYADDDDDDAVVNEGQTCVTSDDDHHQ